MEQIINKANFGVYKCLVTERKEARRNWQRQQADAIDLEISRHLKTWAKLLNEARAQEAAQTPAF